MTANDTRSELGVRFDDLTTLDGMPLILRSKRAWAHDGLACSMLGKPFFQLSGVFRDRFP